MRRPVGWLAATVDAFRDATAAPTDGGATRARVLARAGRSTAARGSFRRAAMLVPAAMAVCSSASVAWTISGRSWRAQAPVALEGVARPIAALVSAGRPIRIIPVVPAAAPEPASANASAEERAYRRAHLAHFADGAPDEALRLWEVYLAGYPRGAFAPEARYNRAICLVRLSRFAEAAQALRPFADGALGGYRQYDAGVLLDWVVSQVHAPSQRAGGGQAAAAPRTNSP